MISTIAMYLIAKMGSYLKVEKDVLGILAVPIVMGWFLSLLLDICIIKFIFFLK